jgi:general secretion pathway protein I
MNASRCTAEPVPEGGFTLIELLVAFALAALVLGALYTAFSQGLRVSLATQHARDAALLAASSFDAETSVPVRARQIEDRVGSFARHVVIRPRPDLVPAGAQLGVLPYEIDVEIGWREGPSVRTVALSTLWMGPR